MIAFILRHRRKVMLLLGILTLWSAFGLTKLRFEFFRPLILPDSDPSVLANNAMGDRFGGQATVMFMVEAPSVYEGSGLQTLKALTKEATELTGVNSPQDVVSLATVQEIKNDEEGFSASNLTDNETALEERFRKSPFYSRHLVSSDGKAALIVASIGERVYPDTSISSSEFLNTHSSEVKRLLAEYSKGDVKVYATGSQLTLALGDERVKIELAILSAVAFLFLFIVFYLTFHSVGMTILGGLALALALTWTLGTMGHLDIPLTTAAIYLVIVIVAIGSSYAIHVMSTVLHRWEQDKSRGVAGKNSVFEMSVSLLTVALMSGLGSVSLLTFDTADIREMGLFQGLGVTFCYLISFYLLPTVVLTLFKRPGRSLATEKRFETKSFHRKVGHALQIVAGFTLRRPVFSAALAVFLLVFSIEGTRRVHANFVLETTVPAGTMPREGFERISEKFGTFRIASVVLQKHSEGSLLSPEGLRQLVETEKRLTKIENIDVLPGIATALNTVGSELFNEKDALVSQERIDQTLVLVGKRKLKKLLDSDGSRALINVVIDASHPAITSKAVNQIRETLASVPQGYQGYLGGMPIVVNSLNRYMVDNKVQSIVMAFLTVLGICALVNGSFALGLAAVFPATIGALLTFGLMGYFGVDLDMGTATITSIAIGVGTDFGVHFLLHFRSELARLQPAGVKAATFTQRQYAEVVSRTTREHGPIIFFDALSNIFGFMPLIFSSFPILSVGGKFLMVNQLIVIFSTFFFMPLMILILRPDFPKRFEKEAENELSDRLA